VVNYMKLRFIHKKRITLNANFVILARFRVTEFSRTGIDFRFRAPALESANVVNFRQLNKTDDYNRSSELSQELTESMFSARSIHPTDSHETEA